MALAMISFLILSPIKETLALFSGAEEVRILSNNLGFPA
jgi:hypothetical protein